MNPALVYAVPTNALRIAPASAPVVKIIKFQDDNQLRLSRSTFHVFIWARPFVSSTDKTIVAL